MVFISFFSRSVGGSSGGEACALASACSVIGIGSDIGGSIRIPAFFNGIYGHKSSYGLISIRGKHPDCKPYILFLKQIAKITYVLFH